LQHLSVGTIAEVEGAFGRFTSAHFSGREQIWVAGGIGITPFLSMAHSYRPSDPKVTLVYSVKSRQELLDIDYLSSQLPLANPQFKFVPFVSEEQGNFMDAAFIEQAVGGLANKEIFLCGPPPMMKSLKEQLKKKQVPRRLIHDEAFSMS
jgi:predicted ferric reductase